MTTATAIRWATLLYDAGKAYPSKKDPSWPDQHAVTVSLDLGEGQQERIWFNVDPLFSLLRKGDRVLVEYTKNRWRLAKQQAPELLAELQSRQPQEQPGNPPPQPTAASQAVEAPQNAEAAYEQSLRLAASRYGRAIDAAKALMGRKLELTPEQLQQPEVVAAVQAMSATLFISAKQGK